ncbi:MAG: hypothetical protein U1F16_04240 [Turneriella sp.]
MLKPKKILILIQIPIFLTALFILGCGKSGDGAAASSGSNSVADEFTLVGEMVD